MRGLKKGGVVKNVKLKSILFERGIKQVDLAKDAGIPKSYISQAIRGRLNLDNAEKKLIADVLNLEVSELFEVGK